MGGRGRLASGASRERWRMRGVLVGLRVSALGERREEGGEWEGEEGGGGEQGWYDYHAGECFDLDEESAKRKDKAFQRLKNDGRV